MKKNYLLLFACLCVWQINAQVLNQNAGWPNAAWTVTGTYSSAAGAFEANPTTSPNFAWDDDDAGNPSDDQIAAESPVINLTAAHTAGEQKVRVNVQYGYNYLANDVLRFEYWDAAASAWVAWGGNVPGNNTTVENNFCTITKTNFSTPDLDIAAFTTAQLTGFRYRIYYNDDLATNDWNWGFCFNSPTIISVPTPCLTGNNYPTGVFTPATCNGFTPNQVAADSAAGDYFDVAVTTGQTYNFLSSVATDFYTISTDAGTTSAASGTQPLTWVSTVTGTIRVYLTTNIVCGTDATDRTTSIVCGTLCLAGTLYPEDTLTPETCDGSTVNVLTEDTWAGEYSNIQVYAANTYTFSSSEATDYLTLTDADGTMAFAVGTGSIANFTPAANGIIRFYLHTDSDCGVEESARERRVVCTTTAVIPGCPINPSPADGSTTAPAFDDIILSWDPPATGDVVSYDVYGGVDSGDLFYFGSVLAPETTYNAGTVDEYEFVGYWQVFAVNAAGQSVGCAEWMFTTESQPTDTPDFVNLQWPPNLTVQAGETGTVYGRVYEPGLTDTTSGQAPGIEVWVGISPEGDDSNPDTWTNWIEATFQGETGNDDEYQANIGNTLLPGTYYYATRFSLNGGPYVYGGINATNPNSGGNFWDGSGFISGVLTVEPGDPVTGDCELASSIPDPSSGNNVWNRPLADGTDLSAVGIGVTYHVYGPFTVDVTGSYTFTSTQDGWDGFIFIYEDSFTPSDPLTNYVAGNDDSDTNVSEITTNLTTGVSYYLVTTAFEDTEFGDFETEITGDGNAVCEDLSNPGFDNNTFTYYPNPVKNVLNLSYSQDITNVEVYNLLGQKMSTNNIGSNIGQVDMSNLASGAYIVKVTANNQVKTVRVIKE